MYYYIFHIYNGKLLQSAIISVSIVIIIGGRIIFLLKSVLILMKLPKRLLKRKPLYVAIMGGEPLSIFSDIKPCTKKMSSAGVKVSIFMNAILLNEEMVKFFECNKVDMVIFLLSVDSDICDFICNRKNVVIHLKKSLHY